MLKFLRADPTVAIDHALDRIEDGGFHPDAARPRVQHRIDPPIEVGEHMLGRGRADVAEAIGTGSGEWQAGALNERECGRMRGHAHTDEVTPGGDCRRQVWVAWQEERKRPRPESIHQGSCRGGNVADHTHQHGIVADVHDERIPVRAFLGSKNAFYRGGVQCVCRQTVDRLRGHCDQLAGTQQLRRAFAVAFMVRMEMLCQDQTASAPMTFMVRVSLR